MRGDYIEIKVMDESGRKLDKFNFKIADKNLVSKIMGILKRKYNLEILSEEEIMQKDLLDIKEEFI